MGDNKLLLFVAVTVIVLVGLVTAFWPRKADTDELKGGGYIRFLAVLVGVVILFFSTSVDRKNGEAIQSELASTKERVGKAESAQKEAETVLIATREENRDLQRLLKQSSAEKQAAAEEAKAIRATLIKAVQTVAEVIPDARGNPTRIRIREAVLFDFDKADLSCESREKLSKVIGFVVYQLQTTSASQIKVDGHTDSLGPDKYNDELSLDRANAVKSYLAGAGIPDTVITAQGLGKRQPAGYTEPQSAQKIADANRTPGAMQKNRRVELLLVSP